MLQRYPIITSMAITVKLLCNSGVVFIFFKKQKNA
jgi:hypothetical protein